MPHVLLHPDSFSGGSLPPPSPRPAVGGVSSGVAGGGGLPAEEAPPKIRAFDQKLGAGGKHEDNWSRTPNVTGRGAIHVKSFHCKLSGDAVENMDRQINEWLDAHPQYEVKFVTSNVGEWTGKLKEPNLILHLWV